MDMIIDFVAKHDVATVLLGTFILSWFKKELRDDMIKVISIAFKYSPFAKRSKNPLHHPWFVWQRSAIYSHLKYIDANTFGGSEIKSRLLKDFLSIKFRVFHDNYLNFCNNKGSNLRDGVYSVFYKSIEEYNKEARKFLIDNIEDTHDKKIKIEYIIKTFDKWHQNTIEVTANRIEHILLDDKFYQTDNEKLNAILSQLWTGFEFTIKDGIKAFKQLNGYLEKVKYK
jgi:hypothetical protein